MTVRAQLKYFDGNNNEVVIGSLDDNGGEGIQDLTLKNSAREYTKVIVSGGNGLFGKFPTDSADSPNVTPQENAAGPEIFLEVFNQSTGVFEVRDRVFAESQGTVSDNGNFKHKRLYGFEKFVGRQNVDLTGADSVTTDIEQVLNDALPSGYVADVPAGATVPSVNNYSFKGRRDQVFKDLRENYNFIINFTADTDGSGNYLVKFEPRGFGGIVDTFEKGVDPVFFDKWTKGDELRRITRAEVVGTDSNGVKVSGTASTNPDNGRFIRRNIGYVNSNSEAQNIAVNLIASDSDGGSPESTEHGRVTAPIDRPATSNLNASIQIINDQINVDDSFTVVQQKDFFHQSQTQYSFEFEKELESRERRDKKDLGNRNSELITEGQQDVGSQSFAGDTGSAPSDTAKTGGVNSAPSDTGVTGSLDVNQTGEGLAKNIGAIAKDASAFGSITYNVEVPPTPSQQVGGGSLTGIHVVVTVSNQSGQQINVEYDINNTSESFGITSGVLTGISDGSSQILNFTDEDSRYDAGDNIEFELDTVNDFGTAVNEFETKSGAAFFTNVDVAVLSFGDHDHTDSYGTNDNDHPHGDNIGTSDFDHGGGSNTSQHGASGTTDKKNVDVATEDKINR